ncbi:MAG: hypothetical protein ABFE13_23955 [Phycisphaerales bacterium]
MSTLLRVFAATGTVAVLLSSTAGYSAASAEDISRTDISIFQFTCKSQSRLGRGCLDGLMASNGLQQRITIYWIEPDIFRDGEPFVRYSDFIFSPEKVCFWIYPGRKPETLVLSGNHSGALLPHENSAESSVRSALAIVSGLKDEGTPIPLEVRRFFRGSRCSTEYVYETLPDVVEGNDLSGIADPDIRILNTLPSGRWYSKEQQADGSLVWRIEKGLSGQPIATVTIRPPTRASAGESLGVFDPNTLGQWSLIPEPYRAYWSFDSAYSRLSESPDARATSRELYERITSYLDESNVPRRVHWAMDRLQIKTALMTDDMPRLRRSVQRAIEGLCADPSLGRHRCLLELARISGLIQKRYPEESQEWLRPFVAQVVEHAGREGVASYLDRLMPAIKANKWLPYGNMLLEEIRRQDIIDEHELRNAVACVEEIRLVKEKERWDGSESLPSVRDYMAQLDMLPPKGTITMDEVRRILEKGLAKCCPDKASQPKHDLVEDVIGSLRLIVGEGPFHGDANELGQSIQRFSGCYSVVNGDIESIGSVLTTFMALSFCDLSTPEDHEVLFSQFRRCSTDLQSQVNTMLKERELDSLVGSADIEAAFEEYEREFRRYIDDPLWPPFKFPWTTNEEARLSSKLTVRLVRLEPILDETAPKAKYGAENEVVPSSVEGAVATP